MTSVQVDLSVEQGATYAFGLSWGSLAVDSAGVPVLDGVGLQTTVPYDLTGCSARMQARVKQSVDPPLMTVTSTSGDITFTAPVVASATSGSIVTNVATVTFAAAHGFQVGDVVDLGGTGLAVYAHSHLVTAVPSSTQISFAVAHVDSNSDVLVMTATKAGTNNISVLIPDTQTDLLTYKTAVYDLKVYWPSLEEDYVIHGNIAVRLRVTADS